MRLEAAGGMGWDRRLPLSGLSGDLLHLQAGVAVGLAEGVEARVAGVGWQRLEIDGSDPTAPQAGLLELDGDDHTSDALDARLAVRVRLAAAGGLVAGLEAGVTLPNAGNESGLGRDETDVAASVLAAWRHAGLSLAGEAGFAIRGNPTAEAAQNDQAVLGVLAELALGPGAVVGAEVRSGFGDESPGNEILTRVTAGGRLRLGAAWLDAAVRRIVGGAPGASGLEAGLTLVP